MSKHVWVPPRLTNFALERAAARLPARAAPSRALVISLLQGRPEVQAAVSRLAATPARQRVATSDSDGDLPTAATRSPQPPDSDDPDAAEACVLGTRPNAPTGGARAAMAWERQEVALAFPEVLAAAGGACS